MNMEDFIVVLVVGGAMLPLARFIYRYHRYSPWENDSIGRVLMQQKVALVTILGMVLAARLFPGFADWEGRTWIVYAIFLWMVVLFWLMDIELEKVQRKSKYDRWKLWHARHRVSRIARRECREERRAIRRAAKAKGKLEGSDNRIG